jgi:arachidonate 15-lipoxygenase
MSQSVSKSSMLGKSGLQAFYSGRPATTGKRHVSLAQFDTENSETRATDIGTCMQLYEWTTEGCGNASLVKGLPFTEWPNCAWIQNVVAVGLNVLANMGLDRANFESDFWPKYQKLSIHVAEMIATGDYSTTECYKLVSDVLQFFENADPGCKGIFDDFKEQFHTLDLPVVADDNQFLDDDIFGWYRVAGPNPMRLRKHLGKATDMFPMLTNEIFRGIYGFHNDCLESAEAENRLFFVDYEELKDVKPDEKKKGYVYAPRALFAVPVETNTRTTILPVAIQCGQDENFPMFTPNQDHTNPVTWLACKLVVQVSDAILHESIYHLGRTHLLMEVVVCATHRALYTWHPLFVLLKPHFYGTAFINTLAVRFLIAPDGVLDSITAPSIMKFAQMAADSITDHANPNVSFNNWMPDVEMERRGVLNAKQLHFPYRDDSIRLWNAILKWVEGYISFYYKSDEDVVNDTELTDWCKEITSKNCGNMPGFGNTADGRITTVDYLVRAVSMIIFTASVQHAAVNFPQSSLMEFSPAMPLNAYAAVTSERPFSSEEDWVKQMMPDLKSAANQLNLTAVLGSLRYTALGEYSASLSPAPKPVAHALAEFQAELGAIGASIQKRNLEERYAGLPAYDYLVPKNIPQSINI